MWRDSKLFLIKDLFSRIIQITCTNIYIGSYVHPITCTFEITCSRNLFEGEDAIGISILKNYWNQTNMESFYESCRDVSFPQTNGKVVEDLLCDGNSGEDCDARIWLNYQGSTSNGFAPYDMIFIPTHYDENETLIDFENKTIAEIDIKPVSARVFSCSEDGFPHSNRSTRTKTLIRHN